MFACVPPATTDVQQARYVQFKKPDFFDRFYQLLRQKENFWKILLSFV